MASEGGDERHRQSLRWSGKQRAKMELKVCVSVTYVSVCVPICMQVHTHVCVCGGHWESSSITLHLTFGYRGLSLNLKLINSGGLTGQ